MSFRSIWLALLPALFLAACERSAPEPGRLDVRSPADLKAHSETFRKAIEEVAPGVWIAIGYGLANAILVEGDDGLIVIDTMETLEEGEVVALSLIHI